VYLPGTVGRAAELLGREAGTRLVYGSAQFIDALGHPISLYPGRPLPRGWRRMRYWQGWDIPQPTLFFDRSLFQEHGQLDESLHYALDYDWLLRVLRHSEAACLSETLALYRMHPHSKTGDWHSRKHLFFSELIKVNRRHAPPWLPRWWPLWFSWLAHESAGLSRRLARGAVRVLKTSTGATRAT
jgi:GT2 family glycosyltransferase